ncbi:rod shape-determining protein MreC [Sandarakinorhabdus sp.]|uniref:rod shape-determining protein MreC n=1 Tax=Sandarakinorhabdus sp. TaxID=1916663 RepID=UPI00286E3145|nr:rod shape-determining protein MreC [Sandarakinorhabdus sp.]
MDWTPAPRRPSAIRREQNLALVSAVVSGGVIAAGLILLLVARVNPETANGVRAAATDIVAPLWSVVRAPIDGAAKLGGDVGDYFGAVSRADQLEAELDKANARLRAARNGQRELQQLKALMAVREPGRTVLATTRIAAATSGSVARTAMLAVGSSIGITRYMPVIGAEGLVGRTLEVGRQSARVLLLTDPLSRVPVIVERTGQAGLAIGRNLPTLLLTDRIGPELALLVGDRIVTSGDGGVYPPGVPVGVVVDPRADGPVIRLATSPLGGGFVTVETSWLPIPETQPQGPVFDAPVPVEARTRGAPPPRLRTKEPAAN